MALVETCLASNEGCARSTKVAREVPGVCMKARGCTQSARGVREGTERMSIVARDEGKIRRSWRTSGKQIRWVSEKSQRKLCPLRSGSRRAKAREKADEFDVHRLQNDLREMPGVPKRSEKILSADDDD